MRKQLKWGGLILAGASLIALIIFLPTQPSLVFYQQNTTHISAFLPLKQDQHFQIIFKHSIHLTDVIEAYEITEDNEILQDEIVYEEFGIGMPSNAEEGQDFEYENGKYHIKNLNNVFPEMKIRNGKTVSEHRLLWGDDEKMQHKVLFNDYFEPGSWFTVKYERLSLFKTWKEVKIHD